MTVSPSSVDTSSLAHENSGSFCVNEVCRRPPAESYSAGSSAHHKVHPSNGLDPSVAWILGLLNYLRPGSLMRIWNPPTPGRRYVPQAACQSVGQSLSWSASRRVFLPFSLPFQPLTSLWGRFLHPPLSVQGNQVVHRLTGCTPLPQGGPSIIQRIHRHPLASTAAPRPSQALGSAVHVPLASRPVSSVQRPA